MVIIIIIRDGLFYGYISGTIKYRPAKCDEKSTNSLDSFFIFLASWPTLVSVPYTSLILHANLRHDRLNLLRVATHRAAK